MSETYPEEAVRVSFRLMTKACLCAGLSLADSEDVAQDIWMWMLRAGVPIERIATPWLKAVVHNYVLRYRRRSYCRLVREGQPLARAPEPKAWQPEARLESKDLLDRVASLLPERERKLLGLIRCGYSLPEASRLLGIPAGSRDYYQGRLIACARRELKPRAEGRIGSLTHARKKSRLQMERGKAGGLRHRGAALRPKPHGSPPRNR